MDVSSNISAACLTDEFGSAAVRITGSARVTSDDHRFDVTAESVYLRVAGTSGQPSLLLLSREFEPQPAADMAQAMGIQGLDFSGHETLAGELRVDYDWSEKGVSSIGHVTVRDGVTLSPIECLIWPLDDVNTGCTPQRF